MPNIWNSLSKPEKLPKINNNNKDFVFGSFNNFNKISNATINVWAKILNSTKSKLLLKTSGIEDFIC